MAHSDMTGSRIRERRVALGLRQAELAQKVGISATYLNLIEHNRRRIAGKRLAVLAEILDVDPSVLSQGAEPGLLDDLRAATADHQVPQDELTALAERYAQSAQVIVAQHQRITALEHSVQALSDRVAHDPGLASAMHDLLSTTTAIGSSASILIDTQEIEPEWQARFHRSIHEDSQRLAASIHSLSHSLGANGNRPAPRATPHDEVAAWLAARGHHFPEFERALPMDIDQVISSAPELRTPEARAQARRIATWHFRDSRALSLADLTRAVAVHGLDPLRLAEECNVNLGTVLRRLAALPASRGVDYRAMGLVMCDPSGAFLLRQPISGFNMPRFEAGCPLWPVFQALSRPMQPIRAELEMAGRERERFVCYAVAEPVAPAAYNQAVQLVSVMLIVPMNHGSGLDQDPVLAGSTCRLCPRSYCAMRRENSVLGQGSGE